MKKGVIKGRDERNRILAEMTEEASRKNFVQSLHAAVRKGLEAGGCLYSPFFSPGGIQLVLFVQLEVPHFQFRISGMSSPSLSMYCLCSISLSLSCCFR